MNKLQAVNISTIRGHDAGDIVASTREKDGVKYVKIFQREKKSFLTEKLFRAYDFLAGNKNITTELKNTINIRYRNEKNGNENNDYFSMGGPIKIKNNKENMHYDIKKSHDELINDLNAINNNLFYKSESTEQFSINSESPFLNELNKSELAVGLFEYSDPEKLKNDLKSLNRINYGNIEILSMLYFMKNDPNNKELLRENLNSIKEPIQNFINRSGENSQLRHIFDVIESKLK